jgi:hypothetical protein
MPVTDTFRVAWANVADALVSATDGKGVEEDDDDDEDELVVVIVVVKGLLMASRGGETGVRVEVDGMCCALMVSSSSSISASSSSL